VGWNLISERKVSASVLVHILYRPVTLGTMNCYCSLTHLWQKQTAFCFLSFICKALSVIWYDSVWTLYNNSISETQENLNKSKNSIWGDACNLWSLCVVIESGMRKSTIEYEGKLGRNQFHCCITLGGRQGLNIPLIMQSGNGESCWLSHRNLFARL